MKTRRPLGTGPTPIDAPPPAGDRTRAQTAAERAATQPAPTGQPARSTGRRRLGAAPGTDRPPLPGEAG